MSKFQAQEIRPSLTRPRDKAKKTGQRRDPSPTRRARATKEKKGVANFKRSMAQSIKNGEMLGTRDLSLFDAPLLDTPVRRKKEKKGVANFKRSMAQSIKNVEIPGTRDPSLPDAPARQSQKNGLAYSQALGGQNQRVSQFQILDPKAQEQKCDNHLE